MSENFVEKILRAWHSGDLCQNTSRVASRTLGNFVAASSIMSIWTQTFQSWIFIMV